MLHYASPVTGRRARAAAVVILATAAVASMRVESPTVPNGGVISRLPVESDRKSPTADLAAPFEVARGGSGTEWRLGARFVPDRGKVCVALVFPASKTAMPRGCYWIVGAPGPSDSAEIGVIPRHAGYVVLVEPGNDRKLYIFGPTSASVDRIEIVTAVGRPLVVQTFSVPEAQGVRVYLAKLDRHDGELRALGPDVLETQEFPATPSIGPGGLRLSD